MWQPGRVAATYDEHARQFLAQSEDLLRVLLALRHHSDGARRLIRSQLGTVKAARRWSE